MSIDKLGDDFLSYLPYEVLKQSYDLKLEDFMKQLASAREIIPGTLTHKQMLGMLSRYIESVFRGKFITCQEGDEVPPAYSPLFKGDSMNPFLITEGGKLRFRRETLLVEFDPFAQDKTHGGGQKKVLAALMPADGRDLRVAGSIGLTRDGFWSGPNTHYGDYHLPELHSALVNIALPEGSTQKQVFQISKN